MTREELVDQDTQTAVLLARTFASTLERERAVAILMVAVSLLIDTSPDRDRLWGDLAQRLEGHRHELRKRVVISKPPERMQ
jgi:hypothetical protein